MSSSATAPGLPLSGRGGPSGYGQWCLPSGTPDKGEVLGAGAARELLGETGVTVCSP
ncbi:NUDIX hydrolase [Streptomyces brevispora]|uniref:NUDIX hydrolase n=1 Tax=Streptomyces brevispora TaxID=887462 RepID=UPI002E30ABA1|nr:NUDIX hydrolase [Streptomyces brevispora]